MMDNNQVKQHFREISLAEARELYSYIGLLLDIREDYEGKNGRKRRKDAGTSRKEGAQRVLATEEG